MTESQTLRLRIVEEINRLPDDKLQKASELLKLLTAGNGNTAQPATKADHNPLLDYIGGVSHGSLSANLDEELYGE
jgi:hypothetical protein